MLLFRSLIFKSLIYFIGAFFLAYSNGYSQSNDASESKGQHVNERFSIGLSYGNFGLVPQSTFSKNWRYNAAFDAYLGLPILRNSTIILGINNGRYNALLQDSLANYDALSVYSSFIPFELWLSNYISIQPEIGLGVQRIQADRSFPWIGDGSESELFSLVGIQFSVPLFNNIDASIRMRYTHIHVYHDYGYFVWNVGAKVDLSMPKFLEKWWLP